MNSYVLAINQPKLIFLVLIKFVLSNVGAKQSGHDFWVFPYLTTGMLCAQHRQSLRPYKVIGSNTKSLRISDFPKPTAFVISIPRSTPPPLAFTTPMSLLPFNLLIPWLPLANTAIPRVALPGDFVMLLLGVVAIEPLVMWGMSRYTGGDRIRLVPVLLLSLLANAISSLLGGMGTIISFLLGDTLQLLTPGFMGYNAGMFLTNRLLGLNPDLLAVNLLYLVGDWVVSVLVETPFYQKMLVTKPNGQQQPLGFCKSLYWVTVANLVSYTCIALYVVGISAIPLSMSPEYANSRQNGIPGVVQMLLRYQQTAMTVDRPNPPKGNALDPELPKTWQQLLQQIPQSSTSWLHLKVQSGTIATLQQDSFTYQLELQTQADQLVITARPVQSDGVNPNGDTLGVAKSTVGVFFLPLKNSAAAVLTCRTDVPSIQPPSIPAIANGVPTCPPGSSPFKSR